MQGSGCRRPAGRASPAGGSLQGCWRRGQQLGTSTSRAGRCARQRVQRVNAHFPAESMETPGEDGFSAGLVPGGFGNGSGHEVKWKYHASEVMEVCELDAASYQEDESCEDRTFLIRNMVQLSTYGDAVGGDIATLHKFMTEHLGGAIGGVHFLPIFPSSGDGGFAPLTYKEVNPKFGKWADVEAVAEDYDLTMEFMLNHISPKSVEFQDFLAKGDNSDFADMFIDWDEFWGPEGPGPQDLAHIRTRKAEMPMLPVTLKDGSTRRLWCTFGPEQIDINVNSNKGQKFIEQSLEALCERGAKMVRLDAFGYATKKRGTPCFFQEPEVWDIMTRCEKIADEHKTGLLCEVHEEYRTNIKLAQAGYYVYDFALPLLVLHAFNFATADNLRNWMRICPRRQITVLDTHDGMGIDDITGLASVIDVDELKEVIQDRLGCNPNFKYYYNWENRTYDGAPHQYNCTYFSALRGNARRYLMARAIQFFTPGTPMVYYVGLFAGFNDIEGAERSGVGRDINRHKYSVEEAKTALEQPVVAALLDLCKFRNAHPAFNGQVSVPDDESHMLRVVWKDGCQSATLVANLKENHFEIFATREDVAGDDTEVRVYRYVLHGGDIMLPKEDMMPDEEACVPA